MPKKHALFSPITGRQGFNTVLGSDYTAVNKCGQETTTSVEAK